MSTPARRSAGPLGRGLSSLIPTAGATAADPIVAGSGPVVREIPVAAIRRNPYQPRTHFAEGALDDLAASVAEHGVLQPVVVVPVEGGYQLIAGERRTRAAEQAGLRTIPAVIRTADELAQLSLALVENLQRSDLGPLEEARAYRRLIDEFGLTQEEVARRVGRSRPAVANTLRLLSVAPAVQEALAAGRITEGHARALAALPDHGAQVAALAVVTERGATVRATESLVRDAAVERPAPARGPVPDDPDLARLADDLQHALGTRVTLTPARQGGRITITWYDDEELGRLVDRLMGGTR